MKFNEKLKELRLAKGYTQEDLASKLSITRQSISKWEQGINEPDIDTLKKLCNILDCSIEDLIDDDKEIETSKEVKNMRIAGILFKITLILSIFISLSMFVFFAAADTNVVIHWGIDGTIKLGSRWYILLMIIPVLIVLGVFILFRYLTYKHKAFIKYKLLYSITGLVVMSLVTIGFIITASFMIANHNKGSKTLLNMAGGFVFALCLSIAPFTHPRFNKRNHIFGFRTFYALSSDETWNKVNSFGSIALATSSFVGFVLTLVFIKEHWAVFLISIILVGVIVTIIYEEIIKRKN